MNNLEEFKEGQLVYAVLRDFRALGKQEVILHEANLLTTENGESAFGYGAGKTWTCSPEHVIKHERYVDPTYEALLDPPVDKPQA
jgi:hypothetical protein